MIGGDITYIGNHLSPGSGISANGAQTIIHSGEWHNVSQLCRLPRELIRQPTAHRRARRNNSVSHAVEPLRRVSELMLSDESECARLIYEIGGDSDRKDVRADFIFEFSVMF